MAKWQKVKLHMLADVVMGQSPPSYSYNTNEQGVPLIQGNADIFNRVSSPQIWTSSPTKKIFREDILLTVRAPVGHTALSIHDACIGRGVAAIRTKKGALQGFVYQALIQFEPRWRRLEQGSTFTAISAGDIKNIELKIPDLPEQKNIILILETWDKHLKFLGKKIEIKKNIKKGLIQQIFRQKISFKDKNGSDYPPWTSVELMDLAKIQTGKRDLKDAEADGAYPFFVRSESIKRINSYTYDGEAILVPGEGNIGSIYHYINGKFDFHQRVYKISDFSVNLSGKYLYYYFIAHFARQAKRNSVRATVDSLRLPTFNDFKIALPSLEEQQKIARYLSRLDKQISYLEDKKCVIDMQRKYLLNNLISGKVRVPGESVIYREAVQNA